MMMMTIIYELHNRRAPYNDGIDDVTVDHAKAARWAAGHVVAIIDGVPYDTRRCYADTRPGGYALVAVDSTGEDYMNLPESLPESTP